MNINWQIIYFWIKNKDHCSYTSIQNLNETQNLSNSETSNFETSGENSKSIFIIAIYYLKLKQKIFVRWYFRSKFAKKSKKEKIENTETLKKKETN